MIGSTIGSYRVTKLLGEGGMGVVYQATDNIEREVAIKALRPQLTHDQVRVERFRSEAMALGRLHHPNITSLFHLLEEDDSFYMVMEFVEGQTLDQMLRQHGALPPRLAIDILIDSLHGFEHAHSRGVVHRDIKASNLMLSNDGITKIMDFGIARMDGAAHLTQTGKQIGTLTYMSPEQVRGLEQDARSDIYSLGILLFQLLTGRVPFSEDNDFELMRAHLEKEPAPASHLVPSLPKSLDEIIAKALAKDRNDRFENVVELRDALEKVALHLPESAAIPDASRASTRLLDRYATQHNETSPVTPVPTPPVDLEVEAKVPVPQSTPPKPAARSSKLPVLVAVGAVVLLVIVLLASVILRHGSQNQNNHVSQQHPKVGRAKPQPVAVATQAPSHSSSRQRTRPVGRPRPHHVIGHKHPVLTRRVQTVKRSQPHLSAGGEKAALRALIKGD